MVATVVDHISVTLQDDPTLTIPKPVNIQDGDLWVAAYMTTPNSAYSNDETVKGWWNLGARAINSRHWAVRARVFNSSDNVDNYTLTLNAPGYGKVISLAIRDHDVSSISDIVQGTIWNRADIGSSGIIIAPSVTTAVDDSLVLAFSGEATNSLGGYSITEASGFELVTEIPEGTTAGSNIEWVTSWSKVEPTAGPTGDLSLLYVTAALNGSGVQLAIPSSTIEPPTTGRIGAHISTSPSHNSITVGIDLLGGTEVSATLNPGNIVKTFTIDPGSGWGNVLFDGLTADTVYSVAFTVDGLIQTDASLSIQTLPTPGVAKSFTIATGSCQFTGSNHPIWDVIAADNPVMLAHMGDLHYKDSTTLVDWRNGVESSLTAPKMKSLLETTSFGWAWDNHDRIIIDTLNLGTTDPATNTEWRKLAGSSGWASPDGVGRSWVIGRVRFIQTDNWSMKDDPDTVAEPRTFLGSTQKQWFKDVLESSTEKVIVWLSQWTTATTGSGRWDSYNQETLELESFIDARPEIKSRLVMVGGDSHSVQVNDGSRTLGRFKGVPSYNISGFNKSSTSGHGGEGWVYDAPLRTAEQPEVDWGGYSRITVTDDGSDLTLKWEAVRVNAAGVSDVMNTQTLTFTEPTEPSLGFYVGEKEVTGVFIGDQEVAGIYLGSERVWP